MNICGITFKDKGKIYYFNQNDIELNIDDYVVVETEKGEQYGKVVLFDYKNDYKGLRNIIRKSTTEDYNKYLKNLSDAKNALKEIKTMANQLGLKMQFIDSKYTFDRNQLLFNFIADERVDFRELVKQLAAKYKTRIELHQIGVRDKSKEIGGIGQCGMTLCCSRFLNNIDTISINMAKNQNIALNPTKINGACGRLLCCLSYEDELYAECRKNLPNVGAQMKYEDKTGRVVSVDILNQKYKIDINGEIKEVTINGCNGCKKSNKN